MRTPSCRVANPGCSCTAGDLHAIQAAGHVRTVGRDSEIADGDVVEFLFSG